MADGWSFAMVGLSPWLVAPLAAAAAWALGRVARRELSRQPPLVRHGLTWLRRASAVAIAGILVEPTLTHATARSELPGVAVLVDRSGSMAVTDAQMSAGHRLDEAVGLGLIDPALRPDAGRRVAVALAEALDAAPLVGRALAEAREAWARGQQAKGDDDARRAAGWAAQRAREAAQASSALADAEGELAAGAELLERLARILAVTSPADAAALRDADRPESAATALDAAVERWRALLSRASGVQQASDAALVAGAEPGSPVATALARLAAMPRHARARLLVERTLRPAMAGVGAVAAFAFDDRLVPLDQAGEGMIAESAPTDIAGALSHLADQAIGRALGAVVLVSDGRQTAGADPTPLLRALAARGVRVAAVMVGDPDQPRDAVVAEVSAPSEVFRREPIRLDVRWRISGFAGRPWDLVLLRDGAEAQRSTVRGDGQWQQDRFELPGEEGGLHAFQARLEPSLSVPATGDETEASTANDQAETVVAVNDDPLRALVVDGTPRWESRYLAAMLESDKRVEVVRRYRSVRLPRGEFELMPGEQKDLDAFDLVAIGDLAPGELPGEDQARLEAYVARRGGFLVCISGPRGMPSAYSLGALAALLPVRSVGAGGTSAAPVTLALTEQGRESPITAILDDPALNARLWPALPPLPGTATGVVLKPGAQALLEAAGPGRAPVVATMRYGAGRVLWLGTDQTWRWRDGLGDRVQQTFWLQAMRWGMGLRLRGKDARLQAGLDRGLLEPGEAAELRARARREDGTPSTRPPRARVEGIDPQGAVVGGSAREIELGPVADTDCWSAPLANLGEGRWRVTVTSDETELAGLAETRDLVVRPRRSGEGIELGADAGNLARLARAGGYRATDLLGAGPMLRELAASLGPRVVRETRTYSLWQGYGALAAVAAALGCEWLWRKRRGLP